MIPMLIYNLLKYNPLKCKIDHYEPRLLKVLEDGNMHRQNTQIHAQIPSLGSYK